MYNETEKHILPAYRGVDRQKCFHLPKAPLGFQWEDEKNHQLSLHHFMDLSFFFLLLLFFKWADGTLQQIISKCSGSDEKTTKTKKRLIFYKWWPFLWTCLSCTQRHRWRKLVLFCEDFLHPKKKKTQALPASNNSLLLSHDDKLKCVYCGIFQGYHKKHKTWSYIDEQNDKILMTNIK